jgi:mannose-6-phosphate isomerase-like protein (cupin superfamily)
MKKLLIAVSILLAIASNGLAKDAAPLAAGNKNMLQTVNVNDIREFNPKDILKKVPFSTEKIVFNTYFLEPRQILPLHKHPATDELFYIVEGRGQFTVGNYQVMVDSGSAIYGPANTPHGLVNSGRDRIVMISVQGPTPVQMIYSENSTVTCTVCGQENIIPEGAKEGDIITCPRCQAKLVISKTKDGKWIAKPI